MPLPFEQGCQTLLTSISQNIGKVHGMVYGCERWNVPSLENLHHELEFLSRGASCQRTFVDQMWVNENDPGPLNTMLELVQNLLATEQLAKEQVGRVAADAWVGEIESYWYEVVAHLTDGYGRSSQRTVDGKWPYQIPPAPQRVR